MRSSRPSGSTRSRAFPKARASGAGTTASLLNLGTRTSERLRTVGIADEATLRAVGATEAYRRLKAAFPRQVSAVALYALHGALTNTHWNDFPPEVKAQMRARAEGHDDES
ncbi:TfoX/Sxy family DNA transformation protein [Pyxidicoccus xibeiensis]|uniref:TfoX/Sxy family DNA transformation protein n=1 Tax=Pyxidicoccus xibeiensis TaxID=2906759 RepID=UPI0020A7618E|nr:TfoX/Sxy family DNA transformation protein [Pyxidicoccus xibeiensis]MCP3136820.1 TfoX/Sxy family protein [Pyxidicoccus xibeiensis]